MDIPRLYKVSALPSSPTAADDGVYFVRTNPSVGYVCYIITNGVAVQQDAVTTSALTTLLSDFVKKDGTVPMTDSLPFDNNWKIGASSFQTGSFPFYYNGSVVAVMNQNGTFQISDATANNHAVTLGQVNGLVNDRVINFENAPLIGFVAGDVNNPPYFYHSSGVFVRLATQSWINSLNLATQSDLLNKANINGSNTTGGSWAIDYILSPVLQGAVGNGQVLNVLGNGNIHYGNNGVTQHRFISSTIYGVTVEVPGYGVGVVWNEFNFDPSTKANTTGNYPGLRSGFADGLANFKWNYNSSVSNPTDFIVVEGLGGGVYELNYYSFSSFVSSLNLGNYALLSQVYTQSQALALFVGLNGVQTISDTKTFDSSPIVPNGTLAGHTINLGQLLGFGYQNASQVQNEVSDQIAALGLAPESFAFFHGSPTIDTDKYREVIANYSGTGISDIDVINAQYGGVVLTVQAGDNQLNLSIDCLIGNSYVSGDEVLPGTATTYVFSDSLDVWIRRSEEMKY